MPTLKYSVRFYKDLGLLMQTGDVEAKEVLRCQAVDEEGVKVCKGRQGHNSAKVQP
jgi:hypothetical protein